MDLRNRYNRTNPGQFFLDAKDLKGIQGYLMGLGKLDAEEVVVHAEKPGEGNMNCVLRIRTNQRSFILKQARPWVEKYPQIEAPIERIGVETAYLRHMQTSPQTAKRSPVVWWFDRQNSLAALEDFGTSMDLSHLYTRAYLLEDATLEVLTEYLTTLHRQPPPVSFPENMAMRRLNHEHIFHFPFLPDNGLDLDEIQPGLAALALPYTRDQTLKGTITALGERYLSPGDVLLHGDFYPGSWLQVGDEVKVIDPEFSFMGTPEFDLGVMMGHMFLASQSENVAPLIWQYYDAYPDFDVKLMSRYAGVEMLRRLIGIAQLPLTLKLEKKKTLMDLAYGFIQDGSLSDLLT